MVQGNEKERRLVALEQPPQPQGSSGLDHADRPLEARTPAVDLVISGRPYRIAPGIAG
jgi:hypothetical protein